MKKLTIKWKIMLWYSTLLVLILVSALPLMYFTLSNSLYDDTKSLLAAEMERVSQTLEFENNTIELNSDLDFVETGTYVAVYSNDNVLLSGKMPPAFDLEAHRSETEDGTGDQA